MAKVILNQTISRPILYNFVQQKIAEAPSECKDKLNAEKKKFMATIKPIKEFAQNKLNNLYPQEDLKILTKYNLSNKESCFWFTDRDKRDSRGRVEKNEKSIYANFCKEGYGGRYSYGSSKKEIGNLSTQSLIALFFDDINQQNGTVTISAGFVGGENPAVVGTGSIAIIEVLALQQGQTTLEFDGSEVFRDPEDVNISISETVSGLVQVE